MGDGDAGGRAALFPCATLPRSRREGDLPDRHWLDRASAEHPVFIQAWAPVIPNVCAFNSAALSLLGIGRDTPDRVANVWIEKDERGEPTGRLRGSVNNYYSGDPFMNELLRQVPMLDPAAVLPGTIAAMRAYNRMGVTTVYEGHAMGVAEIGAYQALRQDGQLTLRVLTGAGGGVVRPALDAPLSLGRVPRQPRAGAQHDRRRRRFLRHDGVTLSRGGPCWPGFLRMHGAVSRPLRRATRGVTFVDEEKEREALESLRRHRHPTQLHRRRRSRP